MSDDAERETPSEAAALVMALRESAAARREDDAATRRLVERMRDRLEKMANGSEDPRADCEHLVCAAGVWLAAHKEDEHV